MDIDELELSTRARNCLITWMGIKTTEELEKYSAAELLNVYGLGRITRAELIEVLGKHGVQLRQDVTVKPSRSSLEAENRKKSIARYHAILEQYKQGYTQTELAKMHKLTDSRIGQICTKALRNYLRQEGISFDKKEEMWNDIVRRSRAARKARKT